MAETRKYTGGCHCGKVRYEVTLELTRAMACNCSICWKKGTVLAFGPREQLTLLQGADSLTLYKFNTMRIEHLFCSTCGVQSFAYGSKPDGSPMFAVNLRCLDGFDLSTVPVLEFDGKSL